MASLQDAMFDCPVTVRYEFCAAGPGELSVYTGEELWCDRRGTSQQGWLLVKNKNGEKGYVPIGYVQPVEPSSSKALSTPSRPPPVPLGLAQQRAVRNDLTRNPPGSIGGQQNLSSNKIELPQATVVDSSFRSRVVNPFDCVVDNNQVTRSKNSPSASVQVSWAERDTAANESGVPSMPSPPPLNWYYKDLFGDVQGPFMVAEMRKRVEARQIQASTPIQVQVGFEPVAQTIEMPLTDMYAGFTEAFLQAPQLPNSWYYLYESDDSSSKDINREQGPYSTEQMRLWFELGHFRGSTKVRTADGSTILTPLSQSFPDASLVFVSPPIMGRVATESVGHNVVAPFPIASRNSGRDLLKHALGPGTTTKWPVNSGRPSMKTNRLGETKPSMFDVTELMNSIDDTGPESSAIENDSDVPVAIGNNTSVEYPPKEKSRKPIPPPRRYGGPWEHIPLRPPPFNTNGIVPKLYAQQLYLFLTRPLHPTLGRLQFYITREIEGSHLNFNKYNLYWEEGDIHLLTAYRHRSGFETYYEVQMVTALRHARGGSKSPKQVPVGDRRKPKFIGVSTQTIAKLQMNFLGTEFTLHNNVDGHQGRSRDLVAVTYEKNRLQNKGPRKMQIAIPKLDANGESAPWYHKDTTSMCLLPALKSLQVDNLVLLINQPPKYNKQKQSYMLDFRGRVNRASAKNFQLVDALHIDDRSNVIMQHGRVGANTFTMDVQHPMSLLQAFAVGISSLHAKKGVE